MEIFSFLGAAAPIARAIALTGLAVGWTLLLARLVGLRAFSKFTAFDFAATIATGSLIAQAGTRSSWSEWLQAMAAIGAIFFVQYLLALGRLRSRRFATTVDNRPVLLAEHGRFLRDAMQATRVTEATLAERVRASNICPADVRAIVLETTGDVSVIGKDAFDERTLEGVRRIG